jgi:hypothetical protein
MSVFDKLKAVRNSDPLPTEGKERNFSLWRPPKAHPAMLSGADAEGAVMPAGRPGSPVEYLRRITEDGKQLLDWMYEIAAGRPYPVGIIQDELGRPRLNEHGEICYQWGLPSLRARESAIEWLSKRGVVLPAPPVSVVAHTTVHATEYDMSVLSLEEQRAYLAMEQKLLRGRMGARREQEAEVDGEVVDRIE